MSACFTILLNIWICSVFLTEISRRNTGWACSRYSPHHCNGIVGLPSLDMDLMKQSLHYADRVQPEIYPYPDTRRSFRGTCGRQLLDSTRPWNVVIHDVSNTSSMHCGGVFLSERWVLLEADCVSQAPTLVYIGLSNTFEMDDADRIFARVNAHFHNVEVRKSDTADGGFLLSDNIALIQLKSLPHFSSMHVPVCIPEDDLSNLTGSQFCYITGYNSTSAQEGAEMHVQVDVMEDYRCEAFLQRRYGERYNAKYFLCVNEEGMEDKCRRATGGPLSCQVGGKFYVAGIAAFTEKNCSLDEPEIYIRVSKYNEWIVKHVESDTNDNH